MGMTTTQIIEQMRGDIKWTRTDEQTKQQLDCEVLTNVLGRRFLSRSRSQLMWLAQLSSDSAADILCYDDNDIAGIDTNGTIYVHVRAPSGRMFKDVFEAIK